MSNPTIAGPLYPAIRSWWRYGIILIGAMLAASLLAVHTVSAAIIDTVMFSGHKYYLISENTATGAATEAHALGGYLATINNQAEQDFLWNTWKNSLGTGKGLWIGLTDLNSVYDHTASNFTWMDGEPVTYTNFAPGEPNDGLSRYREDYVNMDSRFGYNGRWNDVPNEGPGWAPARGIVEVNAPEASTILLLGSGFTAFLLRRRRNKRGSSES